MKMLNRDRNLRRSFHRVTGVLTILWVLGGIVVSGSAALALGELSVMPDRLAELVSGQQASLGGRTARTQPIYFNGDRFITLPDQGIVAGSVHVYCDGISLPRSDYYVQPGTSAVVIQRDLRLGTEIVVEYRYIGPGQSLPDSASLGISHLAQVTREGYNLPVGGTFRLFAHEENAPAPDPFPSYRIVSSVDTRTPVQRSELGMAIDDVHLGISGLHVGYGELNAQQGGINPSYREEWARQNLLNNGVQAKTEADPRLNESPDDGRSRATWATIRFGEANDRFRYTREFLKADKDWTPVSQEARAAFDQQTQVLGLRNPGSDLFNPGLQRGQAEDFAGVGFLHERYEIGPIVGLSYLRDTRTQTMEDTRDQAVSSTEGLNLELQQTHVNFTRQTNQTILPPAPLPDGTVASASSLPATGSDTVSQVSTLVAQQLLGPGGSGGSINYLRQSSTSTDNVSGIESPTSVLQDTQLRRVQVWPGLRLGYRDRQTFSEDPNTPATLHKEMGVDELQLWRNLAVQANLVTDSNDQTGFQSLLGLVQMKPGSTLQLTNGLGIQNVAYSRMRDAVGQQEKTLGFNVLADLAGIDAVATYRTIDRDENFAGRNDEIYRGLQLSRKLTDALSLTWGLASHEVEFQQVEQRQSLGLEYARGPFRFRWSQNRVTDAQQIVRPEIGYTVEYDNGHGLRFGLTAADRYGAPEVYEPNVMSQSAYFNWQVGPATITAERNINPTLRNGPNQWVTGRGETGRYGLTLPVRGLTVSAAFLENPLTRDDGQQLDAFGQTYGTELRVQGNLTPKITLSASHVASRSMVSGITDKFFNLDLNWRMSSHTNFSARYIRNVSDGEIWDTRFGEGYRFAFTRDYGDAHSLSLIMASPLTNVNGLTDGLPDQDARVFMNFKTAF